MAVLTVQTIDRTGSFDPINTTLVAAASGGDAFPNTGTQFAVFFNGSGGSETVTITCQATVDGQAVISRHFTLATMAYAMVGPFAIGTYNDTNQRTNFTYSSATSLKVGIFQPGVA